MKVAGSSWGTESLPLPGVMSSSPGKLWGGVQVVTDSDNCQNEPRGDMRTGLLVGVYSVVTLLRY